MIKHGRQNRLKIARLSHLTVTIRNIEKLWKITRNVRILLKTVYIISYEHTLFRFSVTNDQKLSA